MTDPLRKRIDQLLAGLSQRDCETLLALAEFLAAREGLSAHAAPSAEGSAAPEAPQPKPIPRPTQESVIAALKRLSTSYFMLDKKKLFDETSALMNQHMLEGRPAGEVIDELESLFDRIYRTRFGGGDES